MIKRFMTALLVDSLVLGLLLLGPLTDMTSASVCGSGIAEPPFLSYGVKSNLLLLLDNSGSMLDMAYIDKDTDGAGTNDRETQCFDNGFLVDSTTGSVDATIEYAGNFDVTDDATSQAAWYSWVDPMALAGSTWSWQHITYAVGDLVYENGVIYRAQSVTGNPSAGDNIYLDDEVVWEPLLRPSWKNSTAYHAQSFVYDISDDRLYYSQAGGTSNGSKPADDTGVSDWLEVKSWRDNTVYAVGDHVQWEDVVYYATSVTGNSSGTNPWNDQGIEWQEIDLLGWHTAINYAVGDIVTYDGMIFKALQAHASSGSTLYDVDFVTNWLRVDEGYFKEITEAAASSYCSTASGTKYTSSDLCLTKTATGVSPERVTAFAASGNFLNWLMASKFDIQKDILTGGKFNPDVDRLISEGRGCAGSRFVKQIVLNNNEYLTLAVRGPRNNGEPQKKDKVDSADFTSRIEILGISASGYDAGACQDAVDKILDGGLNGTQNLVDTCLTGPGGSSDARSALNHAMQYCWQDATRNLNTIIGDCEKVYATMTPSEISSFANAYNCSGIYDASRVHDVDRTGYMGRCWELPSSGAGASCDAYDRVPAECDWTADDPCEFWQGGTLLRNTSGSNYTQVCTQLKNSGTACQNSSKWEIYRTDSSTGLSCDPDDAAYAGGAAADWSVNLDPATADPDPVAEPLQNVPDISDQGWWCVYEAMNDYCDDLQVPQVIDPSDQATTTTGDLGNIPALLIDSGVLNQLGVDVPMLVMKGYSELAVQPTGILHSTAGDLRIGAMAFNSVGAYTECLAANQTDRIVEYCPGTNKDGAQVLGGIMLGNAVTDDHGTADTADDRIHTDDLVDGINDVRATSWTPLAEAVYNAIGYYTQNSAMRLNNDDFAVTATAYASGTDYKAGTVVSAGGNYYQTFTGGTSSGTTPENDISVAWSLIDGLDPVTNWCQENHLLIITEGASTADVSTDVVGFIDGTIATLNGASMTDDADSDAGDSTIAKCQDGLQGSTYLDDLTYYAENAAAADLYPSGKSQLLTVDGEYKDKSNITTHIVVAGELRGNVTDTDECSPARLMYDAASQGGSDLIVSASPQELEEDLLDVFNALRQRASAGSAASVISSARGGEGAIYQAIFWPELNRKHADGTEYTVDWAGDVHALFIDTNGYMYEDTSADRVMTPSEDLDNDGLLDAGEDLNENGTLDTGDKRVIIYYDETTSSVRACYNTSIFGTGTCDSSKDLSEVKFLWSAAEWLSDSWLDPSENRSPFLSSYKKRYIYTWNDFNNDGIVDQDTEWLPLQDDIDWEGLTVNSNRSNVPADFDVVTDAQVDDIVNWIRGVDRLNAEDLNGDGDTIDTGESARRSRQAPAEVGGSTLATWRLGDVIHSTPMTVSAPAEGFHLIYSDYTYAQYVARWKQRRHVIYFGGNDGMLHAVNAGFYVEQQKKFCLTDSTDTDGNCDESSSPTEGFPTLGAELWAYVPYNLLPHLKCLTEPGYGAAHKYFVDLRPRIFDVQIFEEEEACADDKTASDCKHPNGWGTILVGGMRFGGVPVDADELEGAAADDPRQFISSYFIFDITDPENHPVLLGEMTRYKDSGDSYIDVDNNGSWTAGVDTLVTDLDGDTDYDAAQDIDGDGVIDELHADLGQSTNISTMVIMKEDGAAANTEENQWYLILGSGPHGPDALKGVSDQYARVSILPLDWLVTTNSTSREPLRIPAAAPEIDQAGGTFLLTDAPAGFTSDLVTLDIDINPSQEDYLADAVYFGTVEGDFAANAGGSTYWDGGGKLYRLITRNTFWYGGAASQAVNTPDDWYMRTLIDVGQPITGAPSAGYDGYNFWIYFGTGRFFDPDDKTDNSQQSFYGVKEPMIYAGNSFPQGSYAFLWDFWGVNSPVNHDNLSRLDFPDDTNLPGIKGLLKVDEIRVAQADSPAKAALSCRDDNTTDCIPPDMVNDSKTSLADLIEYIAGSDESGTPDWSNSADGWYVDFYPYKNRERNVGQSTLLGGLTTFTTYQPYSDMCQAEGKAYLYGLYYQTGTAWHEPIFGDDGLYDNSEDVREKLDMGRGLSTTPNLHVNGDGDQVTAFAQTSTGEIKEIKQKNLPISNYSSGRSKWQQCTE